MFYLTARMERRGRDANALFVHGSENVVGFEECQLSCRLPLVGDQTDNFEQRETYTAEKETR